MTIWLVGGTSDSAKLAQLLTAQQLPWVVTVTTPEAARLYSASKPQSVASPAQPSPTSEIWLRSRVIALTLTSGTIAEFLNRHTITAILDASHPFSTQISQLAINTALRHSIPYLRYERPSTPLSPSTVTAPDFETLLQSAHIDGKRILLTTGVKTLYRFTPWLSRAQVWARILPSERSHSIALSAGFPTENLIQQRPPVPIEAERQLWKKLAIDTVVTKSSGSSGGLQTKQTLAQEMGIQLIAIARPALQYPAVTPNFSEAIAICKTWQMREF